jgi:Protein of unknown function (DUF3108)
MSLFKSYDKYKWIVCGCLLLATALTATAATKQSNKVATPKRIQVTYALTKDGQLFAHTKETYARQSMQYQLQSTSKGVGVYALLGERKLLSSGNITSAGLQPVHFESLQSKNTSKSLINDFDWKQKKLRMQIKGELTEVPLEMGTQDLLSVMYQFMFSPPTHQPIILPVTTGKKLKVQRYQVNFSSPNIQTEAGEFKVVELTNADDSDTKTIYLAVDKHFIPVKIVMKEDGKVLEQTVTKLKFE